jgi:CDP-diacylglycerol--serine O-phosphatidyltransferase
MFTLLGLCAGLTAIRMAIEGRFEMALALVVAAALIDGIDGRVARLLKAQSKFGAELDSLADFVNFGVAPAVLLFTWGLDGLRSFGWVVVMIYAVACGLRLARFNAALEVEKPHWQSNYFTGIPAPAGAVTVLLPLFMHGLGLPVKEMPQLVAAYTLFIGFLMVSTLPTFSGKLAGERISREHIPILLVLVALFVALLLTYPYPTLSVFTVAYLALIPWSVQRYRWHAAQDAAQSGARSSDTAVAPKPAVLDLHPGDGDQTRH